MAGDAMHEDDAGIRKRRQGLATSKICWDSVRGSDSLQDGVGWLVECLEAIFLVGMGLSRAFEQPVAERSLLLSPPESHLAILFG
jgi:hypothetical protein